MLTFNENISINIDVHIGAFKPNCEYCEFAFATGEEHHQERELESVQTVVIIGTVTMTVYGCSQVVNREPIN